MKIAIQQAETAIMEFIEQEIARKATGLTKFATYFLMGAMQGKVPNIISNLQSNPIVAMIDVFDEDGHIHLDKIYSWAKNAMERANAVTISGITFNSMDVEKLYEIMKQKAMY
jgi:hypothetical protein